MVGGNIVHVLVCVELLYSYGSLNTTICYATIIRHGLQERAGDGEKVLSSNGHTLTKMVSTHIKSFEPFYIILSSVTSVVIGTSVIGNRFSIRDTVLFGAGTR